MTKNREETSVGGSFAELADFFAKLDPEELRSVVGMNQTVCEAVRDILGIVSESDRLSDEVFEQAFGGLDLEELGLNVCKVLAHANDTASIPAIVQYFQRLEEWHYDDLMVEVGVDIVGSFQPDAAVTWFDHLSDCNLSDSLRTTIAEGVQRLAKDHQDVQQTLQPKLIEALDEDEWQSPVINAELVMLALEWQMREAAGLIERAFAEDRIDCCMVGDWENVRAKLDVEGLGLPMPEHPFNSTEAWRTQIGIGIFSSEPLILDGELHTEAVELYLERACDAFMASDEGRQTLPPEHYPYHLHQFLDLALSYLSLHVETLTAEDADEILLEIYPRKVSLDADVAEEVIDELVAFWKFCDRECGLPQAAPIFIRIKQRRRKFIREMNDPANFGMAKSLFMAGKQAGFDMTTQEGVNEFMDFYNQSVANRGVPDREEFDRKNRSTVPDASRHTDSSRTRIDAPAPEVQPPAMSLKQRKKLLEKRKKQKKKAKQKKQR